MSITPHHIGCAVRQLDVSVATYSEGLGIRRRTRDFDVTTQGVRVAFLELTAGIYLELVEPARSNTRLEHFMKAGYYHLCFLVDDLHATVERLKAQRFSPLPEFSSEAFGGASCQFLVSPERHLIELAHMAPDSFSRFFESHLA